MATKWRYLERCKSMLLFVARSSHPCVQFDESGVTGGLSKCGLARVCNLHTGLLHTEAQMSLDMKRNVLETSGQF